MIKKLINSIKEFGFTNPVLVDGDNRILAGHARCKAAERMGLETVPTIVLPLKGAAADAYVIVDNKLTELSGWDAELLTEMMRDLEKSGFDLSLTGFDTTETNELFGKGAIENAHEDDFDENKALEEAKRQPVTRLGDIWKLGGHRLLCGDSTKPDGVARLFDGEQADVMVTDPPYNVDYAESIKHRIEAGLSQRSQGGIANDKMSDANFHAFLLAFYNVAKGILKGGAAFYVFHSSRETLNFLNALKEAGLKHAQILTWVKNHFVIGRQDYQWITEPILYGWKEQEGCPHYFINDRTKSTAIEAAKLDFKKLTKDEMRDLLERITAEEKTTALHFDRSVRSELHPTMKSIKLCAELINNSSRPNALVYDGFGGSGSTLIAAHQLERRCFTVELDPVYCDATVKRYIAEAGEAGVILVRNGREIPYGKVAEEE
jgi:DNA modification methylase